MTGYIVGAPGTAAVGGNPGATSLPLTSAPNAGLGGMPVYAIPNKAPHDPASNPLSFPDDKMVDLTNPATLQPLTGAAGRFTVTNIGSSGGRRL